MTGLELDMARQTSRPAPQIVVQGAEKSHGAYRVLGGVSLTIPAGRTTVLLAPFSMGATTLLRTLLGLSSLDAGDVTVGGLSIVGARTSQLDELRRDCGILLLGGTSYGAAVRSHRTVAESLRDALDTTGRTEERLDATLASFGLAEVAHTLVADLPRGIARRAALARTFVGGPGLVVLDQPETGMSDDDVAEIAAGTRRARAAVGATLVVATADPALARALADEVVLLGRGAVVAAGAPADVLVPGETLAELGARLGVTDLAETTPARQLTTLSAATRASLEVIKEERRARAQGELMGTVVMLIFLIGLIMAAPYMPW